MERDDADETWLSLEDDDGVGDDARGLGVLPPAELRTDPPTDASPLLGLVDDAFSAATSARRRDQLVRACRVQLDGLKLLRAQQQTSLHELEHAAGALTQARADFYAEARATHEALQRELAGHIADVLAQCDTEQDALLAPIRAGLEAARDRIASLERAEAALGAALAAPALAAEDERLAHTRARAAAAAECCTPAKPVAPPRFAARARLEAIRLSGGGAAVAYPAAPSSSAARARADGVEVDERTPSADERASAGARLAARWHRTTHARAPTGAQHAPAAAAGAGTAAAALAPRRLDLTARDGVRPAPPAVTAQDKAPTLAEALTRYRAVSDDLPPPPPLPQPARRLSASPAAALRAEAHSTLARHVMRGVGAELQQLYAQTGAHAAADEAPPPRAPIAAANAASRAPPSRADASGGAGPSVAWHERQQLQRETVLVLERLERAQAAPRGGGGLGSGGGGTEQATARAQDGALGLGGAQVHAAALLRQLEALETRIGGAQADMASLQPAPRLFHTGYSRR